MRVDIMTDIETLGKGSDSTVFQISACAFNIVSGEIIDTFNMIVDIESIKDMKVDGSTIKWWLKTDKELLAKLINSSEAQDILKVLHFFHSWITKQGSNKDVYLWGNGILFDNKMIQAQMEQVGLEYPIYYRNDRDMRTLVDLACHKIGITREQLMESFNDDTLVKHDAYDDVRYQIRVASYCWNILVGKEA